MKKLLAFAALAAAAVFIYACGDDGGSGTEVDPDNRPPFVVLTPGQPTLTSQSPTFTYIAIDPDGDIRGFFVSVDVNPPDTWCEEESWTTPVLTPGDHTFYIRARDDDRALSEIVSHSFTATDNNSPSVAITGGPTGETGDSTPTFSYGGTDADGYVVQYYVSIDVTPPTTPTGDTSWTTSALTNGQHVFFVQSEDNEGAKSSVVSRMFSINAAGQAGKPTTIYTCSGEFATGGYRSSTRYDGEIIVHATDGWRGWAKFDLSALDAAARFETITLHVYLNELEQAYNTRTYLTKIDPQVNFAWTNFGYKYFRPGNTGWDTVDFSGTILDDVNTEIAGGLRYLTIVFYGC